MRTVREKTGIHGINADPILLKENTSRAGKASYAKRTGCHDPEKCGGKAVKGTLWWHNPNTNIRKRSVSVPGEGWIQTMGEIISAKNRNYMKGMIWWNDGQGNRKRSKKQPGEIWIKGMK